MQEKDSNVVAMATVSRDEDFSDEEDFYLCCLRLIQSAQIQGKPDLTVRLSPNELDADNVIKRLERLGYTVGWKEEELIIIDWKNR